MSLGEWPYLLSEDDPVLLRRAVKELRDMVAELKDVPAPTPIVIPKERIVYAQPPDLSAIVTAITSLKPSVTAEEIAVAVKAVFAPSEQAVESHPVWGQMSEMLKKIEFRMRAAPTQAYGGGTVHIADNQVVGLAGAANAVVSSVVASISAVSLLAANASRSGGILYNDSSASAYVKYGTGASTSSFTYKMGANSSQEFPIPMYSGLVTAVWDTATGSMRVTEVT